MYGLNADFRPCVGEGMSCVAVAMLHLLPSEQRASRTAVNPAREAKEKGLALAAAIGRKPGGGAEMPP